MRNAINALYLEKISERDCHHGRPLTLVYRELSFQGTYIDSPIRWGLFCFFGFWLSLVETDSLD